LCVDVDRSVTVTELDPLLVRAAGAGVAVWAMLRRRRPVRPARAVDRSAQPRAPSSCTANGTCRRSVALWDHRWPEGNNFERRLGGLDGAPFQWTALRVFTEGQLDPSGRRIVTVDEFTEEGALRQVCKVRMP
jgi:hypothetical protein